MRLRYFMLAISLSCLSFTAVVEKVRVQRLSAAEQSPENPDPRPQIIVTTLGRIVEGKISYSAGGYVVDVAGGSFLIPFDLVKLTASSRHDAYLKYKQLIPENTADNHITLAKWCLNYQLANDAAHELKQALYLDPNRRDAAKLLAFLEQQRSPNAPSASQNSLPERKSTPNLSRSLQGLSPKTVAEYSSAIQPVLMNNCAKGGCHNSQADNDFRLQYVRLTGYGNRLASTNNLATLLSQLDLNHPEQSPFLIKARSNHGQKRNTLVFAPKGEEILARLEQWVQTAARELTPNRTANSPTRTDSASAALETRDKPSSRTIRTEDLPQDRDEFVKQILQQQRRDPFDPQHFNQAVRPSGN